VISFGELTNKVDFGSNFFFIRLFISRPGVTGASGLRPDLHLAYTHTENTDCYNPVA